MIGRRLNKALLRLGHEVYGVDIKDGVDCADVENLTDFKGVSTVFHLAAHLSPPRRNTMDACDGVLEFARRNNAKIIYASSAAVYNPWDMYGVHKLYGERLFHTQWNNTASLRLFNVYGGGGIGLVDRVIRQEHIKVNGSGEQRRDYVHVDDVVEAFVAAFESNWVGTVDIGTGQSHSVKEVLRMFEWSDFEHVKKDGGVPDSVAVKNYLFPWNSTIKLHDYTSLVTTK